MKYLKIALMSLVMYCGIIQTAATTRTLTVTRGKITVSRYDEQYMNMVRFQKNGVPSPNQWVTFTYNQPITIPAGADAFWMEAPLSEAAVYRTAPENFSAEAYLDEMPPMKAHHNKSFRKSFKPHPQFSETTGNDLTITLPTSGTQFTYRLDYSPTKTTMTLISAK